MTTLHPDLPLDEGERMVRVESRTSATRSPETRVMQEVRPVGGPARAGDPPDPVGHA